MSTGSNPFLFAPGVLPSSSPGAIVNANAQTFPVVAGNAGSAAILVLEEHGVRTPHWHPNAWELDYCVSGRARMAVVAPGNVWETFDVEAGQIVFVPQGYFHYIENIAPGALTFLLVFNADDETSIGLAESVGAVPPAVLAATLQISTEEAASIPKTHQQTLITTTSDEA